GCLPGPGCPQTEKEKETQAWFTRPQGTGCLAVACPHTRRTPGRCRCRPAQRRRAAAAVTAEDTDVMAERGPEILDTVPTGYPRHSGDGWPHADDGGPVA